MGVPTRYIMHQAPGLRAMGEGALVALRQRLGRHQSSTATPGPELTEVVAPLPADLVRDYVRHVGGDPSVWKRELPPHLFPQWGFGLAARALSTAPYPLLRVLNGGCRIEVAAPLPANEPLSVSARLVEIDDDGRRAVLKTRVVTGTSTHPEAVVAHMNAIVPLARGGRSRADKPRVPEHAREIAFFRLREDAGLEFAKLTGDFNPIHWVKPAARAAGFRNVILHGFSTLARAWEGVARGVYAGDARAIGVFDARFTRPLVLPAKVGLFVAGDHVFVGDALGGPAYLVGTFESRGARAGS